METTIAVSADNKPVAPLWHLLCVFLLVGAWVGLSLHGHQHHFGSLPPRFAGYILVILVEWFIFAFIWFGLRLQGVPFASLFGEMSANFRKVLRDVGIAIVYLVVANLVLGLVSFLVHLGRQNQAVKQLLPSTPAEIVVYLLVCITAGICEETIFRGYLQRQFGAYTKSAAAGALIQGILFGLAHAYQGWKMIIVIAVYGCMFGALVLWRKSLRPGIIAHFLQDSITGIFLARHI